MKVFRLACSHGHDFEGWFGSSDEFDRQQAGGEIACPLCGNREVTRLPSAPYVNTGVREARTLPVAAAQAGSSPKLGAAIAALRAYVMANTEDVGRLFPEVARRMHYGEESHRGIRGHATSDEAAELREEGIDALTLPPGIFPSDPVH